MSEADKSQGRAAVPNYEVGYKKPPKHTQFKKGKSGNPRGVRPQKTLAETLRDQMQQLIPATVNGKRKRITKQDALAMSHLQKAIAGDHNRPS